MTKRAAWRLCWHIRVLVAFLGRNPEKKFSQTKPQKKYIAKLQTEKFEKGFRSVVGATSSSDK
ncbi:hypothetical protein KC19_2G290100 [Ceratodon purpureus]|uniref:Uncharacterized protein n=1 Tax=Ceratodon purpureus TaxID=3225 RepID=A0A8T0J293_CERPU|nr:hypothetical protein KC19_2G290100 [Ceratodon purpureus]